jgi:hypothetical protein
MRSSIIVLSLAFSAIATPVIIKKDSPSSFNCNKAAKCCVFSTGIILVKGNEVVAKKGASHSTAAPQVRRMDRGGIKETDYIPFNERKPNAFDRCPWAKVPSEEEYKKVMAMDLGELKEYSIENRESIKAVMDSYYQNGF